MEVDSRGIFAGLKIMDTKYASELNKYPVLFFSFKDIKGNKRAMLRLLKLEISREYEKYKFLSKELDETNSVVYQRIKTALLSPQEDLIDLSTCIAFLSTIIFNHYKVRPILLIDEYDTPMIAAYEGNFYDELRDFFKSLYSSALKDNPNLNFAVMTGIQRVAKENIFSGLNNLKVCSVVVKQYRDKFGLTQEEASEDFYQEFEILISSGEVEIDVNLTTSFFEIQNTSTLWGLLINSGYLTVSTVAVYDYELNSFRIPNKEVKTEFQSIVASYTKLKGST